MPAACCTWKYDSRNNSHLNSCAERCCNTSGRLEQTRNCSNPQRTSVPQELKIEPIGTLSLNARHDCYETPITVGKAKVKLSLKTTRFAALEKLCQQIVASKVLLPASVARLLDTIERDLLPVKNADWLEPHEKKCSSVQFRRAFKPAFIEFTSSGSDEWGFDDGGMFMGHDIVVRGSLKAGPKMADLHG